MDHERKAKDVSDTEVLRAIKQQRKIEQDAQDEVTRQLTQPAAKTVIVEVPVVEVKRVEVPGPERIVYVSRDKKPEFNADEEVKKRIAEKNAALKKAKK